MKINIRSDSVLIEGYVNAVERNSKPLISRIGRFIERICKGAFERALRRSAKDQHDVHILLNHDWDRDLGSIAQGNLELYEDSIGLYARAEITDAGVVDDAKHNRLVGWSFGFWDTPDGVEAGVDDVTGLPLRRVTDLILDEVSILNTDKTPAYDGTLIMARDDDNVRYYSDTFSDDIEIREDAEESAEASANVADISGATVNITADKITITSGADQGAVENQPKQDEHPEAIQTIDYSVYEEMISEMKGAY